VVIRYNFTIVLEVIVYDRCTVYNVIVTSRFTSVLAASSELTYYPV